VAKVPADGYTLLYASAAMMGITPQLRKVTYDPVKDFDPIGRVISSILVVTVNRAFPFAAEPGDRNRIPDVQPNTLGQPTFAACRAPDAAQRPGS
jgi:hypothetical protein